MAAAANGSLLQPSFPLTPVAEVIEGAEGLGVVVARALARAGGPGRRRARVGHARARLRVEAFAGGEPAQEPLREAPEVARRETSRERVERRGRRGGVRAARSREELRRGVARRCGHVLLCRPCSDFVCACPKCGAHVAGVGLAVR